MICQGAIYVTTKRTFRISSYNCNRNKILNISHVEVARETDARSVVRTAVILLQIVMVSTGTHIVKNHESQSRTNESLFEKKGVTLGPLGN